MRIAATAIIFLALSACTPIPEQIQGEYPEISPARVEPGIYGSNVRWGGVILDAEIKNEATCFEVLSRDLDKYLRPKVEDRTAGRYIACKSGFHDPEVFTKGREITIIGQIRDIETRPLEEFNYRYPVVDVSELVLWQKRRRVVVHNSFHDPFWGPYWHHPWGYYYPYYRYPWGHGWSRGYSYTRELLPNASEFEPVAPSTADDNKQ